VLIIVLSSVFVLLVGWTTVELVGNIAEVPRGLEALPTPVLPDFSAFPALLTATIAAAVVGLAESSGVIISLLLFTFELRVRAPSRPLFS
jgi:SulP family sulfate permease